MNVEYLEKINDRLTTMIVLMINVLVGDHFNTGLLVFDIYYIQMLYLKETIFLLIDCDGDRSFTLQIDVNYILISV